MTRLVPLSTILLLSCSKGALQEPCPAGSHRQADGLCHLDEVSDGAEPDSGSGSGDGGDGGGGSDGVGLEGFAHGDPILRLGEQGESSMGGGLLVEWVDAVMLDDQHGMVVGQGGWRVIDLDTIEEVRSSEAPRGYRIDSDGELAVIATRTQQLLRLDVRDPLNPVPLPAITRGGAPPAHEGVAVDEGRVLVGWTTDGAILFGTDGAELGRIPAAHAFAVGLKGERAVLSDGDQLSLWDISTPSSPVELDRLTLTAEGRDIAFDGERLAVGLGGLGVDVLRVEDDALVMQGHLSVPGSALSVSLDGDLLWIGAWEVAALAWLGEGGPVVLGHEPVNQSAMGIGGRGGRALVADWFYGTVLERVPDVAGPELVIPEIHWLDPGGEAGLLSVRNGGAFNLELQLTPPDERWTFSDTELVLEPGASANLRITPPADLDRERTDLQISSNDPDEQSLIVSMRLPEGDIGTLHAEMSLQGFAWPDPTPQTYTLGDLRGKVVLLVYFALF